MLADFQLTFLSDDNAKRSGHVIKYKIIELRPDCTLQRIRVYYVILVLMTVIKTERKVFTLDLIDKNLFPNFSKLFLSC